MATPDPNQFFYGAQTPAKPTTQTTSTYQDPYTSAVPYGPYLQPLNYSPSTLNTNLQQNLSTYKQNNPMPAQQPASQPANNDPWGQISQYYGGWNRDQALADFNQAFGGDLNRLMSARGVSTGGESEADKYRKQMEGNINNAYSGYFNQLDQILSGYPQAQANQEQIVNNSFNQSLSDLNASNQDSLNTLSSQGRKVEENQVKTLRDLSDNIMNQYRAGNVYLGTRGAGDSSAADMYSFALNKLGNKQRGDVTAQTASIKNDIADREMKVKNIYTQELGRLNTEKQNAMISLADQFRQAQDQLRMLKANGELSKGTDLANLSQTLLNNALNQMNTIQANIAARQNALQEWAMSNSKNVGELKNNMASMANFNPTMPVAQTIDVRPQTQSAPTTNLFGYGTSDEQKRLYGMGNSAGTAQDFENRVFGGWGNGLLNR